MTASISPLRGPIGPSLQAAVERSAVPAAVSVAVERLADSHPGLADRLEHETGLRQAVVAVTAASRSLTELCVA